MIEANWLIFIAALLIVGTDFGGGGSSGTNATHTWEESCSTVALVADAALQGATN